MKITFQCPKCAVSLKGAFNPPCPSCGFTLDHLTGKRLSGFQTQKWHKHRELLSGANISLHGGDWNASFTHNGDAALEELVRFTITFGDAEFVTSARGNHQNPVLLAYVPEVIGSGSAITAPGMVPCSGVCIISPHSLDYGHPYPAMDDWIHATFPTRQQSLCKICGQQTAFAEVICGDCYANHAGSDWRNLLKP